MPQPPVEVYGLDEFESGARKLVDNIDDASSGAFDQVADQVAATVRGRLPRRTGRLAASVTTGGGLFTKGAAVGIGAPYAGWIDYGGTRGRPYVAQGRYLYPTAHAAEPQLRQAGENTARDEIRSMIWPRPNKW